MYGYCGKYELIEPLGVGGMAEVFRARKQGPGSYVRNACVKRIRQDLSRQRSFIRLFEREASIAAGLSHANIVQVYDFDVHAGRLYLAMELVQGIDLSRILTCLHQMGGRVSVGFAKHVTTGLLEALDYAHGRVADGKPQPVIHRDVSPQNILISDKGEVKLADFGIARVVAQSEAEGTVVEGAKGKDAYCSPEQARGEQVGPATDLYSTGIVLYEMLAGELPTEQVISAGPAAGRDPALAHLSDVWTRFVERLVALEAGDRFASAGQALAALGRIDCAQEGAKEAELLVRELSPKYGLTVPTLLGGQGAVGGAAVPADAGPGEDEFAGDESLTRTTSKEIAVPSDAAAGDSVPEGSASVAEADAVRRGRWLKAGMAVAAAAVLLALALYTIRGTSADGAERNGSEAVSDGPTTLDSRAPVAGEPGVPEAAAEARPAPEADDTDQDETGAGAGESAVKGRGSGFLQVNCRPWALVRVDGRDQGSTPIKRLRLRAGRHRVTLVNEERGYERTFTVDVPRGGTARLSKVVGE